MDERSISPLSFRSASSPSSLSSPHIRTSGTPKGFTGAVKETQTQIRTPIQACLPPTSHDSSIIGAARDTQNQTLLSAHRLDPHSQLLAATGFPGKTTPGPSSALSTGVHAPGESEFNTSPGHDIQVPHLLAGPYLDDGNTIASSHANDKSKVDSEHGKHEASILEISAESRAPTSDEVAKAPTDTSHEDKKDFPVDASAQYGYFPETRAAFESSLSHGIPAEGEDSQLATQPGSESYRLRKVTFEETAHASTNPRQHTDSETSPRRRVTFVVDSNGLGKSTGEMETQAKTSPESTARPGRSAAQSVAWRYSHDSRLQGGDRAGSVEAVEHRFGQSAAAMPMRTREALISHDRYDYSPGYHSGRTAHSYREPREGRVQNAGGRVQQQGVNWMTLSARERSSESQREREHEQVSDFCVLLLFLMV
jgi:hypothetical protein